MEPHHRRSWQRHPGYSGQAQTGRGRQKIEWNPTLEGAGRHRQRQTRHGIEWKPTVEEIGTDQQRKDIRQSTVDKHRHRQADTDTG